MDPGAYDDAARRGGAQRGWDERADGSEDDRGVERLRSGSGRGAGPLGAERPCERLRAAVLGAREREHAPALVDGDLADDVRGGAEPIEPEPDAVAGQPQRPVADQSAAQQRRDLEVGHLAGERQAEALVGDGPLGVAAVDVAAGET